MFRECPGTKTFAYPQIIIRSCPNCGEEIEFFEYENQMKCPNCGKMVHREASEACITWCQYAEKCIDDLEKRGIIDKERAEDLRKIMKKNK